MSHATVLVILREDESLEEVMAPFDENASEEYLEFEDRTEEVKAKAKEKRWSQKKTAEYYGYKKKGKRYGYMHNPKGFWDWYVIGGCWSKELKLKEWSRISYPADILDRSKDGTHCNACRIEDFDYEGQKKETGYDSLFYAVLKDGTWHSKGDLGWFGISMNENKDWPEVERDLIESARANPDSRVVLVDYHI